MRFGLGAVFVGALFGIALAVVREISTNRAETSPPALPPLGAQPLRVEPSDAPASAPSLTATTASAPSLTATTAPAPSLTATTAPATSLTATTAPATSLTASTASAAPVATSFPILESLPPLTTAKELERSELRCYELKLPDECERASVAYAAGLPGTPDPKRAATLAKVAVTFVVRQCENRSPHACLALAGRYKMGYGVPQSDRKATQILAHARELCRERSRRECVDGEPR